MEHDNQNLYSTSAPNPNLKPGGAGSPSTGLSFSMEALAPCLADLKRQLELRQAMH